MPLGYDRNSEVENEKGSAKAGVFAFKVDSAQEKFFKTGNEGLSVKLLVGIDGRDISCFVNMSYLPKALWKLREFLDSVGLDFDNPPETHELVNRTGMASFDVSERGYLEVKKFLDPVEQTKAIVSDEKKSAKTKAVSAREAVTSDDVPF